VLALAAAVGVPACLGYEPRWGQAKASQQRVAAATQPATIASSAIPEGPKSEVRTWRTRFRPNAQYLAQTIDAPTQIANLVEDANGVLSPIGVKLEVERIVPWSAPEEEGPPQVLARLEREDRGADVDLVVGMFGALPGRTDALHEVGMATLLGKHVVVRAAARVGERDAVEQAFRDLSEDERARILKLRKRHRALAVFLHEVGHCLGALHEADPTSLMNPKYDPKMSGFGDGAVALMRAAVEGPRDAAGPAAVARAQLAVLERPDGPWVPAERDDAMVRLRAMAGAARDGGASAAPPSAPADEGPPELPVEARQRFVRALQAFRAGAVGFAQRTAQPLFAAYPDVYAVQDLRCQIATLRWLPRQELVAECAPMTRLLSALDAGAPKR
jgi:hypothetical protein